MAVKSKRGKQMPGKTHVYKTLKKNKYIHSYIQKLH